MRNKLVFTGVLVSIYLVFVIQAYFVWTTDVPEILINYWLGYNNIKFIFIGALILFPFHIFIVVRAAKQKKIEWHWAVPLLLMPYMIGVILQGLMF